jgi:menaquinone-dependent protoporphyrinogen oxidase
MISILIAYTTTEGHTARIAKYIAKVIRDHGCEAYPVDIRHSSVPVTEGYDAVIVGASIRPPSSRSASPPMTTPIRHGRK